MVSSAKVHLHRLRRVGGSGGASGGFHELGKAALIGALSS